MAAPLFLPVDGRVVHLVDGNDQAAHAGGLGQQHVLPGLAAAVKAGLKFALSRRHDEDADIGLRRAANHVGHVRLVARSV